MKILLTHLTAKSAPGEYIEPRGLLSSVHLEPAPGFFLRVTLGEGGLIVRNILGDAVAIPLADLLALAQKHLPELSPPQLSTLNAQP